MKIAEKTSQRKKLHKPLGEMWPLIAMKMDSFDNGKGAVLPVENRVPFEGDVLCLSMKIEIYLNQ